jgi:D-tyrosyl-tRNA(Tyr) deacylase
MRLLIQRVKKASVSVDNHTVGSIEKGILVLLGIKKEDDESQIAWLTKKLIHLRLFKDENNKMNKSVIDEQADILVVSQFTLYASCNEGRRPDFGMAASGDIAESLYHKFLSQLETDFGKKVQTGKFGADMQVSLVNDGPVTFILER